MSQSEDLASISEAQFENAAELSECKDASDSSGFRAFKLAEPLLDAVEKSGYAVPTPIQSQTIPLLLEGRDVLGQAQTGTGKTAAFALPLLSRIDLKKKRPQVLVLTPTRELAIQVAESFEKYAGGLRGFRAAAIYGGQDYHIQFRQLNQGVQVVVGTPGRVMDHMRRGSLKLDDLQCLVLDEADEMLRMGFADDVEWVLTQSPERRQMALFSATMPGPIRQIAQKHLVDPVQVTIAQKSATADTINQHYLVVAPHQKQAALARVLEAEPIDGVLVFVKTRSTTEPLAEYLAHAGLRTAALNGDIAQKQRERIIERLRANKIDVIVATDVAARGLDVQRISHVINYDLPFDSEAYVHRIGRTGRAGRSGEAILFVHPRERRHLKRLEHATRKAIEPMALPSNRDINKQRVARFHERITAGLGHPDLESFQSIVEQYRRDNDAPLELIAASLAALAAGDAPLFVKDEVKQADFSDNRRGQHDKRGRSKKDFRAGAKAARCGAGGMKTYRVEVGQQNHVEARNLVGAIANEAGIGSALIGKIRIFDRYSTIDLPDDMPPELLSALRDVSVGGRPLRISQMDQSKPRSVHLHGGKRPYEGHKRKPKQGKRSKAEKQVAAD